MCVCDTKSDRMIVSYFFLLTFYVQSMSLFKIMITKPDNIYTNVKISTIPTFFIFSEQGRHTKEKKILCFHFIFSTISIIISMTSCFVTKSIFIVCCIASLLLMLRQQTTRNITSQQKTQLVPLLAKTFKQKIATQKYFVSRLALHFAV